MSSNGDVRDVRVMRLLQAARKISELLYVLMVAGVDLTSEQDRQWYELDAAILELEENPK